MLRYYHVIMLIRNLKSATEPLVHEVTFFYFPEVPSLNLEKTIYKIQLIEKHCTRLRQRLIIKLKI